MQFNRQGFNNGTFNVDGTAGPTNTARTACHAPVRAIHARATITYSSPDTDEGVTIAVTTGGTADGTNPDHVVDGGIGAAYPWFSLRTDDGTDTGTPICKLDGTYHPMPSNSVGWWSTSVSGSGGTFSTPPVMTVIFDVARPFYELELYGDDKFEVNPTTKEFTQNYPVAFTIQLYSDDAMTIELYSKAVTTNTLWNWSYSLPSAVAGVKAMKVTITSINLDYRPAVITEFFSLYSETYTDSDIMYMSVLEERDYQGSTIPLGNVSSNECVLRLKNTDNIFSVDNQESPLYDLIRKNRKIDLELGIEVPVGSDTVWYPAGTYWSQNWSAPQNEAYAEVVGFDILERMRTSEYYSSTIYEDCTLDTLAKQVLSEYQGETGGVPVTGTYLFHDDMANITVPYAYFGRTDYRSALVEIAEAAMCCLYIDRIGRVVIDRYDDNEVTTTYDLTASRYFSKDSPLNFEEMVNRVEVTPQPRTLYSATEYVYEDAETFTVGAGATVTKNYTFVGFDSVDDVETVQDTGTTGSYFTQTGTGTIHINSQENTKGGCQIIFHNATGSTAQVTGIHIRGDPFDYVYKDTEQFTLTPGETTTRQCIFSTSDPVHSVETVLDTGRDSYFTQTGTGIHVAGHTQTNYTWMAEVTFHNAGTASSTVTGVYIRGKPLRVKGGTAAFAEDESSIRLNGKMALQSPIENNLIQTTEYAQEIANDILAVYKDPRRDVTVQARGYIMSNLGERMRVYTISGNSAKDYLISRQRIEYDGGLSVEMTGLAIAEDE